MLIQNDTNYELIVSDALYKIPDKITIHPTSIIKIPDFKCTDIDVKDKAFRRLSTRNVLKIEAKYEKISKHKKYGEIISNSWCEWGYCTCCYKHCYMKNIDEYAEECEKCNFYITTNEDIYKCYHN